MSASPSTHNPRGGARPSARPQRNRALSAEITRVHGENFGVYGTRRVWHQLGREGLPVPRGAGQRLMRAAGLAGAARGKTHRTTVPAEFAVRQGGLLERDSFAAAPNQHWVADITFVAACTGFV